MVQKKSLLIIFFVFVFAPAFGQSAANPKDPVYDDILIWENLLLIPNQSPLRPYPLATIQKILEQVIESGNSLQAGIARAHYERIFGKALSLALEYKPRLKVTGNHDALGQQNILPGLECDFFLTQNTSLSLDLGFLILDNYDASYKNQFGSDSVLTFFARPEEDAPYDPAELGSFKVLNNINMNLAYSQKLWYLQGGMSRASFGPFHKDSVSLSSDAYHNGNLTFFYNGNDLWNYQQSFFIIGSTDNRGEKLGGEKYFHLHSLEYNLFPWLSLSYFESMVYGGTFDPIYFLPLPFMAAQSIGSFGGNLQMGLGFKLRPGRGLLWAGELLVDDISVNDLFKLKFDTKMKLAGITGLSYAFDNPVFKALSLNYTLVAPYMYTHRDEWYSLSANEGIIITAQRNVQNFSNNGYLMGSELLPNSDRIALSLSFDPLKNLRLDARVKFSRHANTNESLPYESAFNYLKYYEDKAPLSDGGIHNFAVDGEGYMSYAQDNFMFMAQTTKMHIFQTGIDMSYVLPFSAFAPKLGKAGSLSAKLSYDFEYIHNNGVQQEMYKTLSSDAAEIEGGPSPEDKKAMVEKYREAWRKKLYDSFSHYISLSLVYRF